GDTAGLHLVADVPARTADRVVREAGERGVRVETLDRHHAGPRRASGPVVGYGSAANLAELRAGRRLGRRLALSPRDRRGPRRPGAAAVGRTGRRVGRTQWRSVGRRGGQLDMAVWPTGTGSWAGWRGRPGEGGSPCGGRTGSGERGGRGRRRDGASSARGARGFGMGATGVSGPVRRRTLMASVS